MGAKSLPPGAGAPLILPISLPKWSRLSACIKPHLQILLKEGWAVWSICARDARSISPGARWSSGEVWCAVILPMKPGRNFRCWRVIAGRVASVSWVHWSMWDTRNAPTARSTPTPVLQRLADYPCPVRGHRPSM